MERGLVTVSVVTYNSERYIAQCLESVFRQDYPRLEVIVVDNASADKTRSILREFEGRARVIYNRQNVGFTAGQNQAIRESKGEWVLVLNPDVRLMPDWVSMIVAIADPGIGSVCGKLRRMSRDCEIPETPVIDSTGLYFTPALRHFDRGSGELDDGRYDKFEYVFGASGAAALYRREMIEDVSVRGEFFDSDFFAYREDADVAWRAQLLGWKCLYNPLAVAYHVRTVLPTNRRSVDPVLNMHSVKNRWLMRIKNMTPHLYWRTWVRATLRDAVVTGGCLFGEFRSLRGFWMVGRNFWRFLKKRRQIMGRRRASDEYIARWFSNQPVSDPAPAIEAAVFEREKIASR
ncbi:MAG: glycosyltransferase family 2 protein [Acidobacteriaceae bacterium]|nr:glycosyltransferase family 2 protein [Acidobacteriaceae bacterium]MBV9780743.1 glycosyltransferase family 2 protein [Acidobacteriaceae bacterium]